MLALISFMILISYLVYMYYKFGLPEMISDTYFQLKSKGWIFSIVMLVTSITMLISILDTNQGIQCLAFLGCCGLAFVGCAPNYITNYTVHKTAAIIASIGCISWSLSVNIYTTVTILLIYLGYLCYIYLSKLISKIFYLPKQIFHPWYFLELAGFIDTYITYFLL